MKEQETYELTICGERESFVIRLHDLDYLSMIAKPLIDNGLTVRMKKEDGQERI